MRGDLRSTVRQATLFDGDTEVLERLRNPVFTARVGKNGPLFADICRLYVPDGSRVLDCTYGLGGFWTTRGLAERYRLVTMDIERPTTVRAALEHLPFGADTFDAVVLDPPYANHGGEHTDKFTKQSILGQYNLKPENTTANILGYYTSGMAEAWGALRSDGILIVKCQDGIESGRQHWTHLNVLREAEALGFTAEDLFVLVQDGSPAMRHNYQKHARKNHSYAWVFRRR